MPKGAIVGAIAGVVIGWIIAAVKSRFTYEGGYFGRFEGMGCLATLLLYLVLAAIGALVGYMVFPD